MNYVRIVKKKTSTTVELFPLLSPSLPRTDVHRPLCVLSFARSTTNEQERRVQLTGEGKRASVCVCVCARTLLVVVRASMRRTRCV